MLFLFLPSSARACRIVASFSACFLVFSELHNDGDGDDKPAVGSILRDRRIITIIDGELQ